jgi:hypothetical protein
MIPKEDADIVAKAIQETRLRLSDGVSVCCVLVNVHDGSICILSPKSLEPEAVLRFALHEIETRKPDASYAIPSKSAASSKQDN